VSERSTLPRRPAPSERPAPVLLRALVVEDEPAWQQIISELLVGCGLTVDVAGSAEQAVLLLRQAPHRVAVVDLALGEGMAANHDGLRVLQAIQRQDPGCVSLLLTGYATVELAVRVLTDYGALSCLEKAHFDRAEFRRWVQRALSTPLPFETSDESPVEQVLRGKETVEPEVLAQRNTVLVVEDDAGWRSILSELLSDAGYPVRLCNSYGEAVGCLRRESYLLAVIDLSLGPSLWDAEDNENLDGYPLLALARDQGVPTLVVSGVAAPRDVTRAYECYEVFACLEKRLFDRRAFLQTVAEMAEASQKRGPLHNLTLREVEVLTRLAQGFTNKEIAESLVISTNTVKRHLQAIFDKLGVHTRAAAAAKATNAGLAPDTSPAIT
jgi:DNA-binding NarL/FixJ family response regulator